MSNSFTPRAGVQREELPKNKRMKVSFLDSDKVSLSSSNLDRNGRGADDHLARKSTGPPNNPSQYSQTAANPPLKPLSNQSISKKDESADPAHYESTPYPDPFPNAQDGRYTPNTLGVTDNSQLVSQNYVQSFENMMSRFQQGFNLALENSKHLKQTILDPLSVEVEHSKQRNMILEEELMVLERVVAQLPSRFQYGFQFPGTENTGYTENDNNTIDINNSHNPPNLSHAASTEPLVESGEKHVDENDKTVLNSSSIPPIDSQNGSKVVSTSKNKHDEPSASAPLPKEATSTVRQD